MYFYFRKYLNSEQHMVDLPIQNLAIGVSVEHDAAADIRLPVLLATPARWRFVSYEPALGPVDFRPYISHWEEQVGEQEFTHRDDCLCGGTGDMGLHGIIMGGESGKNARPMHPDWARSTRDACADAGVNFFFKQWGEWLPGTHFTDDIRARDNEDPAEASKWPCMDFNDDGLPFDTPGQWCDDLTDGAVWRVGKRLAGRLLDGREHNELPWAAA
jgi:Bacteriophage protein gp37